MSHLVKQTPSFAMNRLDLLGIAAEGCSGKLKEGQKTATYYDRQKAACDHAITFADTPYEIGVRVAANGELELHGDLYDWTLRQKVSSDLTGDYGSAKMDKIFEGYKVAELGQLARRNGARLASQVRLPDGRVALTYAVQG